MMHNLSLVKVGMTISDQGEALYDGSGILDVIAMI